MKPTFFKGVVLGTIVSLATLMATAAFAGVGPGAVFNLGAYNGVNATTKLAGSTAGGQLAIVNASSRTGATGLAVSVHSDKPPLTVNSSTKVTNLNADLLNGHHSNAFQARVTGNCVNGTAISAIAANGAASCSSSRVFPISANIAANSISGLAVPPSHLQLTYICSPASAAHILFAGSNGSTLNWMFSQGGSTSTVNANGAVLNAGNAFQQDFALSGNRLEGQFIYQEPGFVITVNIHVFGAGGCEFYGTGEIAATS